MENDTPASWTEPPGDPIGFEDDVPNDLEGVKCIVRKAGQATDYMQEYSLATGALPSVLTVEDQNYDLFATLTGYEPFSILNKTATLLSVQHVMTAI